MPENGKSRSSVKEICLTIREKSWEPHLSFRKLGISDTFIRITVFFRFFLSHSTKKLREEPSNVSKCFKCEVTKNILNENGLLRFSVENFLAQSAEKFRCGTLRYIRKIRLSKNFMPKRVISLFSVEFFSRILPTKLGRESLFVSESLGRRRLLWSVAGYRDSPLFFLASQYWKISWVTTPTFQKFSGIETFHAWERKITFFSRKILSHSSRKILGTTPKFQKTWDLGNFHSYHGFPSILFCLRVPKNFARNHLMFQKVSNVR